MHVRALLGTVLLVAAAPAQTFIVDANNGPGTNFLDIASAVPAVPDGATLLVRAGSYVGFSITAKGLAIRGDPNVVVTGSVSVRNTARQQTVELRGLGWTAAPSSTTSMLILDSCAGLLLLDSLTVPGVLNCAPPGLHCLRGPAVAATSCQQILLHWCSIAGNVGLQSSNAVIDGCTLYGEDGVLAYNGGQYEVANPARTALSLGASTVQSADSFVYGGPSTNLGHGLVFLGAPGVDMSGANLRLLSGQVTEGSVFPA
ncbi:MAG TPA: hypothetical protein VK348_15050, partial [Planctomycetota bacterium]|nr:hypothetical protein [Planctomycetota bacterium]